MALGIAMTQGDRRFDERSVRSRTQAVQLAKGAGLIP